MRMKMFLGAALVVALGIGWVPAEAQKRAIGGTANTPVPPRQLARGYLWNAYENTGSSGARPAELAYATIYADLDYPGTDPVGGKEFSEYYGGRPGKNPKIDFSTHQGRGHGWWIAAKDPASGKAVVSYSSPLVKAKEESDDVIMVAFDPAKDLGGRFAKVGNNVINVRSGRPMATWWPGTSRPLDALEPAEILNYQPGQYNSVATDNYAEDIIVSKWATKSGITGTKVAMAWNHPDYDDLIIEEWVYENTGDKDGDGKPDFSGGGLDLKNVYFAFQHRFINSSAGASRTSYTAYFWDYGPGDACQITSYEGNPQDDKIKYTEAPNYDGPASARGLKMIYQYDWNNFCLGGQYADDVGDPFRSAIKRADDTLPNFVTDDELLSPTTVGWAEIDVDPTDGFVGDNDKYEAPKVAQQPFAHNLFYFRWRQSSITVLSDLQGEEPDPNITNDEDLYKMLVSSPDPTYWNTPYLSRKTRASGPPARGVPLLPIDANPTGPMPYVPNPEWEWKDRVGIAAAYSSMDTYGPYDLAPGQKVKFVFAFVAGAPVESNITAFNIKKDNSELKKEENGAAFANLVKHLNKAKEAYALGYDLPNQPPDVDAKITSSENARVRLVWTDAADKSINPDMGKPDVAGYRVYQSTPRPDLWTQVGDVKVGDQKYYDAASKTYKFEDPNSLAGFGYYYTVRAYQGSANTAFKSRVTGKAAAGVSAYESGPGEPGTFYYAPSGASPFSPVQVPSTAADRMERKIAIVPNPYVVDGVHTYAGTDKVRILNIPRHCKIRFYSIAGDLVGELEHNSQTVGEASYNQLSRTFTNWLSFGIYYVTVESLVPESLGKVQRTTFVVIR